MLANVVEVDMAMQKLSLSHQNPGAVLCDFHSAFPSLSHDFLLETLRALKLPACFVNFVSRLYEGNGCKIAVAKGSFAGFGIRAGIRQGCPLSPLLFALVADLLVRRLAKQSTDVVRAFADDVAVVTPDLKKHIAEAVPLFNDFGKVSGLFLNIHKTVVIPLGDETAAQLRDWLREQYPCWATVAIEGTARYLGFMLGPERGESSWDAALRKFQERALLWAGAGLGLYFTTLAYNIYISSVLGFLLQLEPLPTSWDAEERSSLRRLLPGPAQWILPEDVHNLRRSLGFPAEFADLREVSLAARLRVHYREAQTTGGLRINAKVAELRATRASTDYHRRLAGRSQWYGSSFAEHVHGAVQECRAMGVTIRDLEADLTGGMPLPLTRSADRRLRQGLQRATRTALCSNHAGLQYESRLRHKLERWKCGLFPRIKAMRARLVSLRFRRLLPPRVCSAILRTWFNGWCSHRRFQGHGPCILGCGRGEDSIEHYALCKFTGELGANLLALPRQHMQRPDEKTRRFLLLEGGSALNDDLLIRTALLTAVIYRLHCQHRRGPPLEDWRTVRTAGRQALHELVGGHARATAAVEGAFVARSTSAL
jgi:hypothetical protein